MEIKKNDEFEVQITDSGSEGEGIGRFGGMPFFIKGAIPGDTVLAGVTKMKKTYGYARIVKILNPSPDRITPECPIAGRCGGCQLQHMSYAAQLKYKQDKVLNDLVRIGGAEKERILFYPIIGMEEP
ncbi:MAG: class I SAM-dependent RNA methyltransferase, partial [Lachnospiraceae bacterium]|nr:class I SAM-dependent RNA methyltransferase [Lachnospiraceae bacterium]